MKHKRLQIISILSTLIAISGCIEYKLYQYKLVNIKVLEGDVWIQLIGRYSENYSKDGKKYADWGFPYNLQFGIELPYDKKLSKLMVKSIELTGLKTSNHYHLPDTETNKINDLSKYYPDDKGWTDLTSVGGITSDKFEYEDFLLKATLIIYEDGKRIEQSIEAKLETDFKKEKRSDWFDEQMSV